MKNTKIYMKYAIIALIFGLAAAILTQGGNIIARNGALNVSGELTYGCPSGMVKVGSFCIDKYEPTVWSTPSGGSQYGNTSDNYPCSDTGNDCGKDAANPIYARSVTGETPARYITWFQAAQACASSGKRLCTNVEWQTAAAGTDISECNTGGSGEDGYNGADPERTGSLNGPGGTGCVSSWGTYDMVGNVWEWTADWSTHPGWNGDLSSMTATYGSDGYWHGGPNDATNPDRGADNSTRPYAPAMTGNGDTKGEETSYAAFVRGGNWVFGANAGVFALSLRLAPSSTDYDIGFRCCR